MSHRTAIHRIGQATPRRLFAVAVAAAVVGLVLTLSFGFADHSPAPHGVRLAVAAPAGLVRGLAVGLAHRAPGGFTVVAASSASAVIDSVRAQSTVGGLTAGPTGPVTIVTAGAVGAGQQQAISAALTAAATALHRQARPLDVAPLPVGDRAGLSVFVFELGLLLPSVLASIGVFLIGRRFRLWWRVTAAVLFAVAAACGSVLALDTIFGALTGAGAALIGVGFLAVLAAVDLLHLAERRRAPEREAEIYATPGTVHLRQRLARQRAATQSTAAEYNTSERR